MPHGILLDQDEFAGSARLAFGSLITPAAAGILRVDEPQADRLDRFVRHDESILLRFPTGEHAVLRHRSVAGRLVGITPAAVFLLPGLQRFQQSVDLMLILAGIQFAEKHDRQAGAVDIRIPLQTAASASGGLAGIDGLLHLRIRLVIAMLDIAQPDQRLSAEPAVGGRIEIFHALFDRVLHFRIIGRDGLRCRRPTAQSRGEQQSEMQQPRAKTELGLSGPISQSIHGKRPSGGGARSMYLRRERRHENPDHLLVDAIGAEW